MGKIFFYFLIRKIENASKHNVLAARVELLQVSGVAVESKRCCGVVPATSLTTLAAKTLCFDT